jgi:iron complex transport system substrate-binding protein
MKKYILPTHTITVILLIVITTSCGKNKTNQNDKAQKKASSPVGETGFDHTSYPSYAELFSVEYKKHYKKVQVKNPFDTTRNNHTYILVNRGLKNKADLPEGTVIELPVRSLGVAYATHIGYLEKLNLLHTIKGVSQKKYIKNDAILKAISGDKIKEFGPSHNINIEKLLNINPQLLLVAPFKDNRYNKIRDVGINIAVNASYMETSPLARAEWIKFIAYFFNKEEKANQIFESLAHRYNQLTRLATKSQDTPTIFSGKKIGQVWYVPGGNSYMAKFFNHAGARYLWRDNEKSGSLPLDFETVFYKAKEADYWCIKENYKGTYSYEDLESEFIHYIEFDAFKNHRILFCNTHIKPYYEKGVLEPHIILADLIHILHPELLPGHKNKYYEYLNKEKE